MPISRLTAKFQVTIPKLVRDALHLDAGDRVEFTIAEGADVRVRRALPKDAGLRALEYGLAPEWESIEDEEAFARL